MKSKECEIEYVDDLDTKLEMKVTVFKLEEIKKELKLELRIIK